MRVKCVSVSSWSWPLTFQAELAAKSTDHEPLTHSIHTAAGQAPSQASLPVYPAGPLLSWHDRPPKGRHAALLDHVQPGGCVCQLLGSCSETQAREEVALHATMTKHFCVAFLTFMTHTHEHTHTHTPTPQPSEPRHGQQRLRTPPRLGTSSEDGRHPQHRAWVEGDDAVHASVCHRVGGDQGHHRHVRLSSHVRLFEGQLFMKGSDEDDRTTRRGIEHAAPDLRVIMLINITVKDKARMRFFSWLVLSCSCTDVWE